MGSAARRTIIRPLDDIDVLASYQNKGDVFEEYRADSQKFLYKLKNRINAKTQVTQVGASGQAVCGARRYAQQYLMCSFMQS